MSTTAPDQSFHAMTPPMTLRHALRDWGSWLVIVVGTSVVAYIAWLAFWAAPGKSDALLSTALLLLANATAVILSARTALSTSRSPESRRAWLLLAGGFGSFLFGNIVWMYYNGIVGTMPYPSLADAGYLGFYPLVLWGLLSFPTATQRATNRFEFWLDVGLVLLGGGMVIWYFVLGPSALAGGDDMGILLISLAYPLGDLTVLFGMTTIAFRRARGLHEGALRILVAGIIANAIANIGYGSLLLAGIFTPISWPNAFWVIAYLLLGVSGQYQHLYGREERAQEVSAEKRGSFEWLPYAAILVGYGVLLIASVGLWGTPLGGMIVVAVALTGLLVARQWLAVRVARGASTALSETARALEAANEVLEVRVQERTAQLEAALAAQMAQAVELQESLAMQQQLNTTIAQLSVPIIPVHDDVLIVPLVGTIDADRASQVMEIVLQHVQNARARQVFLDVTGVAVIDTQVAHALLQIAGAVRLLGAEAVLAGVRPEVAQTLVALGADLGRLRTVATLQSGLSAKFPSTR